MPMRDTDVEAEASGINDEINNNRCMSPEEASRQQSIDFLEMIIDHCRTEIDGIKADMEKDEESEPDGDDE